MTGSYFHLTSTIMKFHLTNTIMKLLGLRLASYKTNLYGKNFITVSAIIAWNNSQKLLKISLRHLSLNKIKAILSDGFFSKY